MRTECILSDYLEQAMEVAAYDKLDDGTFSVWSEVFKQLPLIPTLGFNFSF